MAGPDHAVRVRVPATSANLGPGFDTLGLALGMHDEVTARVTAGGLVVEVSGEGEGEVPLDDSHLVVSSMLAAFRRWHEEPVGLQVACHNAIPHGRGLGSSAAAIVAGVVCARELLRDEPGSASVSDDDVLALSAELEGHPDNVAAAVLGGFTMAWSGGHSGSRASALRLMPHDDLLPVVCVPGWVMSTESARGLLPARVPHADAVFNSARSALMVAAVTRYPERLFEATQDRLHQAYRAPAMRPTAELLQSLRARGLAAVLSGAGPTVLVLCDRRSHGPADVASAAGPEWVVSAPGVDRHGATATVIGSRGRLREHGE